MRNKLEKQGIEPTADAMVQAWQIAENVKKSGDWQYYSARFGQERDQCAQCAELAARATTDQSGNAPAAGGRWPG